MNSLTVTQSASKDKAAKPLVATFFTGDGYSMAVPGRYCSNVVSCFGDNPSYAMVGIPAKEIFQTGTWDQTGPNALSNNGGAKKIKLLARCSVGYLEGGLKTVLMNGWVVYETHHLREDSITVAIFDDRHIMTKYTNFGRMRYEPGSSGGAHVFISNPSDKQVFNEGGHGNCIDTPFGPRFSPGHRYGHLANGLDDGADEAEPGSSTSKARKWTVKDIIGYLRDMFYDTGRRPPLGQDFGPMELPMQYIKWPKGLGANIVENRTPRDLDLDGLDLLTALRRVVQYAGPYDIHMEPINEKESELKVIDFALKNNSGSMLYTARYLGATIDECMNNPCIVWDGWVKESALQTFSGGSAVMGDAPATELMASTDSDATSANAQGTAPAYLERGWTTAEETLFKSLTVAGALSTTPDAKSFNLTAQRYPNVFSWYKLSALKNPFGTTKWATYSQAGSLRIKAHQLTSYNSTATNPLGMVPREIIIEYKLEPEEYSGMSPEDQAGGYWKFAGRYSELQLSPDGRYVQVPGLRDTQKTYHTWAGGPPRVYQNYYDGQYMTARHIRIQLAAESNHCLVARSGANDKDPSGTLSRMDTNAPKNAFQVRSRPMDYIDWTRTGYSMPVGRGGLTTSQFNTLTGAGGFSAKQTAGNELFTDHIGDNDITNGKNRLARHADIHVKNYKKLNYEGVLIIKQLTPVWRVGMQISVETQNTICKVGGIIRCVIWSASGQTTSVEFGPNEPSAIWDGPIRISQNGNGSGAIPSPEIPTGGGGTGTGNSKPQIPENYASTGGGSPSSSSGSYIPMNAPARITSANDGGGNNSAIANNVTAGGGGSAGAGGMSNIDADIAAEGGGSGKFHEDLEPARAAAPSRGRGEIRTESDLAGRDSLARGEGATDKGIFSGESLKGRDEERAMAMKQTYRESGRSDTPRARGLMAGERNAARTSNYNLMGEYGLITSTGKRK